MNDNDPFQIAKKIAYAKGELSREYFTKDEALDCIAEIVWGYYEDVDHTVLTDLDAGLQRGEYTMEDLLSRFQEELEAVFERAAEDEEDEDDEQDGALGDSRPNN